MLSVSDLADAINVAIGATDRNGDPISTTPEMMSYAQAIIDTLQAGDLSNAAGTVTATGIPATPIADGAATGGLLDLDDSVWSAVLSSGFPTAPAPKLLAEAAASVAYLEGASEVEFASGKITGTCTATPVSPGALAGGAGSDGTLDGPEGDPWAADVTASQGIANTNLAKAIYAAVSAYVKANASASYPSGGVTGTFLAGGGSMQNGAGAGGSVS